VAPAARGELNEERRSLDSIFARSEKETYKGLSYSRFKGAYF
jgi:hypothetical protein